MRVPAVRVHRSGTGRQYGSRCPRLAAGGRHGSWYVRLELPAGLDGRRRRIRRGGYPSRKAALDVLGRLRNPKAGGSGGVVTVGDWLAHWLVSRTSPAASTVRGYALHVRLYLGPYLGEVLLTELTVGQVRAMFTAIIRSTRRSAPGVGRDVDLDGATLRAALNGAIRRGLITDNPAARMELPRARRPRRRCVRRTGSGSGAAPGSAPGRGVDHDADRPVPGLGQVAPTVCRLPCDRAARAAPREAAGLRWRDVDPDGRTVVISQQLQQYDGRLAVCPPKTWRTAPASSPWTTRRSRRWPSTGTGSAPRPPPTAPATAKAGTCSPA